MVMMHKLKMLQTGLNRYIIELDGMPISCKHISFDVGINEAPIAKIETMAMANAEFDTQIELDDEFILEQVYRKLDNVGFGQKLLTAVEKHRGKG